MPSPCPSDGTEPICLFPVHPVKPSVFPWLVPGVLNPFPGPDMNMLPFTDVQNAWASPAPTPKGENAIFQNGMRIGLWSPWVSSLTRPELTLLLGGERGSVPQAVRFHALLPCVGCRGPRSGSCRQPRMLYRDGSRMKQRWGNVLRTHGHPAWETKDRTTSPGEVERLQDNWRGF